MSPLFVCPDSTLIAFVLFYFSIVLKQNKAKFKAVSHKNSIIRLFIEFSNKRALLIDFGTYVFIQLNLKRNLFRRTVRSRRTTLGVLSFKRRKTHQRQHHAGLKMKPPVFPIKIVSETQAERGNGAHLDI